METLRGYKIKGRKGLNHWEALLEEWLLAMERYSRIMNKEDDAAYWYNERANIGVLAGAAWRCGRIALEEFQHDKVGRGNKKLRRGRCDLWIASEQGEEYVEAKFKWISLRSRLPVDIVDATMSDAMRDAKHTRGKEHDVTAVAVGFFPLYVARRWADDIDRRIEDVIDSFHHIDYHAMGWCFPKENRGSAGPKNVHPGIVMLLRNVDY